MVNVLIDAEFRFIHEGRREDAKQFQHTVLQSRIRLREGVQGACGNGVIRIVRIEPEESRGLIGEALVDANHP